MNTLEKGIEIDLQALGGILPFSILADKSCKVAWAGSGVTRRIPWVRGVSLEGVLRTEDGELPSLSLLEESLEKPGRWILLAGGERLPLTGAWVRAGLGYLLVARPDPVTAEEMGHFSFQDFPWDDLPVLYLTSQDEFRNSLEEVKAMAGLLKKRETYLQNLLDTIPVGVILVDREARRVAGVNSHALELIGTEDPNRVLGKPCTLFCSHLDGVCPYLDEGKALDKEETILRRLDGSTIPVLKNISAVEMDGREYLLDSIIDIRERKALERRILQAQKMESVGRLAAGVAHEINTPLQFVGDNLRFLKDAAAGLFRAVERAREILSSCGGRVLEEFLECLEECDLDFLKEEIPEALDQSLEGLGRVREIVEAMQSLAEPRKGRKAPVDVNEEVRKAVVLSRGQWGGAVEVEADLAPDLPKVSGYSAELQQTFLTLLSNAVQAVKARMEEEEPEEGTGKVRIRTRPAEGAVEIQVEDEGMGIAEELRDQVFNPFFSTKGVGIGSGKGLAYAQSVVAGAHGGEIFFETEEGKGTTFTVRLPLDPD